VVVVFSLPAVVCSHDLKREIFFLENLFYFQ
jgi:hypothetical protein